MCAVSGGADSMCLLHLLLENSDALGIEIRAAHYEHGIRGEESLRDADFVRQSCEELGVELALEHGCVPAYAREKRMGIEEAARCLRYGFLEKAASDMGCDWIATAHNADDNAETMLFNLARGSGTKGLCGIPQRRGILIRPLLNVTRAQIEAYMLERGHSYVSDSSNDSDDYSRNLIRHHVLPELKRINPQAVTAMGRAAELVRQDEDCLDTLARQYVENELEKGSLPAAGLLALHPAVSSRVLRILCPLSLSAEHVSSLMSLAAGEGRGFCDVPGLRVRREQGRLFFDEEELSPLPERELLPNSVLELPEASLRLRTEKLVYNGEIHGLFKTYWVKCESICGRLVCSSRRPGDRISLQGRNCTKSLKAIFTEKKMTRAQRESCPVIRDDKGVMIVVGHGADRRCGPSPGDEALRITVENME